MMEIVKPFELVYKLMNTKFKLIESIGYGSPFILMTEVSCTSPWQLLIVEAKFEPVCMYMGPLTQVKYIIHL